MRRARPKVKHRLIEDRDAKSRTIEDMRITAPVEPDVEVNEPIKIMGDEGPIAETNPHNKAR